MTNCSVMTRIFLVNFARARQAKVISEFAGRVLWPVLRRDVHRLSDILRCQPLVTKLQHNPCASQRALKHTSKFSRGKGGKQQSVDENDEEDEDSTTDITDLDPGILSDVDGKDVKIVKKKLNSLRLDTLLKAGLGTAKNKIDIAFYESKIRVNGEKLLKKSKRMEPGDEIDLIKGPNVINPAFLDVGRVVILRADYASDLEKVAVVLKRYRLLTIENYPNPYKTTTS
ncbi:mitochondrial transcription rescue factor 1-like [Daphnia carinata]|uniref:mitochondrial transcription rescue factor 1-like n=1 Tax=Daphnia carinata TaxID=120202 RepID=UPI00257CB891|nr:mitochondrial transcription rescue factor 1-like [Daphnia carinata]